jgi:hypothetical protein
MIFSVIIKTDDHGSDLRVWVELRGFEPLTPRELPAARSFAVIEASQRPLEVLRSRWRSRTLLYSAAVRSRSDW